MERGLLTPFLNEFETLKKMFISKLGDPFDAQGRRRSVIAMVANEGVMDLLLNFLCSTDQISLDLKSIVVFVGDEEYVNVIEELGATAIYSPSLGSMPKSAAKVYLDDTFGRVMWFKVTSVYLALATGFNVLFQDVDLVWMKNPFQYLMDLPHDIIFMDDGQISPRYSPFYVNSGFYFVKYNEKTVYLLEKMMKSGPSEISRSHSHQQVLIRHITEAHHLFGLQIYVLPRDQFPSGKISVFDTKLFIVELLL